MIGNLRRVLIAVMLAGAVTANGAAPSFGAVGSPQEVEAPGCAEETMGTRTPVLLIHGYNDDARSWAHPTGDSKVTALSTFCDSRTYVETFGYGNKDDQREDPSLNWVTDPTIARALAKKVVELAETSSNSHGPGKVALVAHSMGGLAVRCAVNAACGGQGDLTHRLGPVITFGTPNTGSFLRGDGSTAANLAVNALVHSANVLCSMAATPPWTAPHNSSVSAFAQPLCDWFRAINSGPAATAFTPGSQELKDLPNLPSSVELTALAGSIRLKTTLFHQDIVLGDVGDAVVLQDSAVAELSDPNRAKIAKCGSLNLSGLDVFVLGGYGRHLLHGGKFEMPSCWHMSETSDLKFLDPAKKAVDEFTDSVRASFIHPSWGRVTVVTTQTSPGDPAHPRARITVVDSEGKVRWSYTNTAIAKMGLHNPATDKSGNIFIDYNPGRYNGVIVLRPTPDGISSLGTLPEEDNYTARFYSAETRDVDGDRVFEIVLSSNDCVPTCADGKTTTTDYRWDGGDYSTRATSGDDQALIVGNQCPVEAIVAFWNDDPQDCLSPELSSHLYFVGPDLSDRYSNDYRSDVALVQLALSEKDRTVFIDGKYGQQTVAAVRSFQAVSGITVNGIVGVQTWKALFGLGSLVPATAAASGEPLVEISAPASGSTLGRTFTLAGRARTFEATVVIEVSQNGNVVERESTVASAGAPELATWSKILTLAPGNYRIEAFEESLDDKGTKLTVDVIWITVA